MIEELLINSKRSYYWERRLEENKVVLFIKGKRTGSIDLPMSSGRTRALKTALKWETNNRMFGEEKK